MAMADCISKLRAAGIKVSDRQEKILTDRADELENIYRDRGDVPEAEVRAKAERDTVEEMKINTYARKKAFAKTTKLARQNEALVKSHKRGIAEGIRSILVPLDGETADVSVDALAAGIYGRAASNLGHFAEKFRSKIPSGVDNFMRAHRDQVNDLARALHGSEAVSDVAKAFARELEKTRDFLLRRLEAAGISIKRLDGYAMSHKLDNYKIATTKADDYVEFMMPLLDRQKMYDKRGNKFTDESLREYLKEVHRKIKYNEAKGGSGLLGDTANALGNRHRSLHYKDGDAFIKAYERFGSGDMYDSIMESLQELAMDAALAERFGPDPDRGFKHLLKLQRLSDSKGSALVPDNALLNNEMIYNYMRGNTSQVGSPVAASALSTIKNFLSSVLLHSAVIMAVGDQAFIKSTADVWGTSYANIAGRQLADLFSVTKSGRKQRILATRLGQILDWAHGIGSAANRFGDVAVLGTTSKVAAGLADFTIRATGLAKVTRTGRHAFGLELNHYLAMSAGKAFDALDVRIQNGLKANGITPEMWDAFRKATIEIDGVRYLDPTAMADEAGVRFAALINAEARRAVPEPGAEARALMTGGAAAGTLQREVRSTFFHLQAFPLTVMLDSWRRLLLHPAHQSAGSRLNYGVRLAVYGTLAGGVALQMRDILNGKDPRNPADPQFMLEAMLMAGTFGMDKAIPTDLFEVPRGPASFAYNSLPPIVKAYVDVVFAGGTTAQRIAQSNKPLKPIVDFLTKYMPAQHFATKLLVTRLFKDQLRMLADPNAGSNFRRTETNLRKRTGQEYWWRPGQTAPDRGPEVTD